MTSTGCPIRCTTRSRTHGFSSYNFIDTPQHITMTAVCTSGACDTAHRLLTACPCETKGSILALL